MYRYIKLRNRLQDLYNRRFQQQVEVKEIGITPPTSYETTFEQAQYYTYSPFKVGDTFIGRDQYYWLKIDVQLPQSFSDKQIVGFFDIGRTGLWFESGMEALLYIDGKPYQAVDRNHKEILLDIGERLNWTFYLQVWSGLEGGGVPTEQKHTFRKVSFSMFDKNHDQLYLEMKHLFEANDELEEGHPYKVHYERVLLEAYKTYNEAGPREASEYINKELEALNSTNPVVMNCVSHTHIDLAWLWRLKHASEKARRSFYTMLRLMEEEDFYFFQSQPQLYQWIEDEDPELFELIQKKVSEGNWEVGGGMWVEADLNLSSGEFLARQLLHGDRYLNSRFPNQRKKKFLWLPDVFGYNWSMPQLMKSAGINHFFTTKMSWNEYEKIPNDTFTWRGIDGSEVLCHFITTPHPYGDRHYVYNAVIDSRSLCGTWDNYRSKNLNQELLVAYGYGDGGGGANRDMIKSIDITNKIPTLPTVEKSRVDDYISRLDCEMSKNSELPIWFDELYLQFHRGTYTTQGLIKKWNRVLENRYISSEMLATLVALEQGDFSGYNQHKSEEALKLIMTNQFHDILPGSSIREVNEDAIKDYQIADQLITQNNTDSMVLTSEKTNKAYSFFSPIHKEHNQLIKLPKQQENIKVYDQSGNELEHQTCLDSTWVLYRNIKPLACSNIYVKEGKHIKNTPLSTIDLASGKLENLHYTVKWNTKGQLTEIYDKDLARHLIHKDEKANEFQVFEDKPHGYEAWEVELDTLDDVLGAMEIIEDVQSIELMDNGPLMTVLKFTYRYKNSSIQQLMKLYKHDKRIDFDTMMDWQDKEKLVKVSFPLNIFAREVCCDTQFGYIKRPTHRSTKWDESKFEICAHNWVDMSQLDCGVSLMNDGKYGHDVKDHRIRLSLIKSSIHPDTHGDIGKQNFTYSLYPHTGNHIVGNTHIQGVILNNKLEVFEEMESQVTKSLFNIAGTCIHVDAIKKAEDSNEVVLRFHEYGGGEEVVKITSPYGILGHCMSNILEEESSPWDMGEEITLNIKPFEIMTLKIKLDKLQEG